MSAHPIHRVSSFEHVGQHGLRIEFADGSRQTIDCTPVLAGELHGPLRDPNLFARVHLDPEVDTLVWPNGADLDPERCTTGRPSLEELTSRARTWTRERIVG